MEARQVQQYAHYDPDKPINRHDTTAKILRQRVSNLRFAATHEAINANRSVKLTTQHVTRGTEDVCVVLCVRMVVAV